MEKNYKEIEMVGATIEQAVSKLLRCRKNGELGYINFNGHKLYSDTVTMDNAYIEIVGKTKAQFDEDQKKWREDYKRREEEFKVKIPELTKEWIEKGHGVLSEKYWLDWDKCVPIRLGDLYHGMELGNCLDIVKELNDGCDLDYARNIIYNQGHSGMSFSLVKAMVSSFCDRGEEFAAYVV